MKKTEFDPTAVLKDLAVRYRESAGEVPVALVLFVVADDGENGTHSYAVASRTVIGPRACSCSSGKVGMSVLASVGMHITGELADFAVLGVDSPLTRTKNSSRNSSGNSSPKRKMKKLGLKVVDGGGGVAPPSRGPYAKNEPPKEGD